MTVAVSCMTAATISHCSSCSRTGVGGCVIGGCRQTTVQQISWEPTCWQPLLGKAWQVQGGGEVCVGGGGGGHEVYELISCS
jgi:hypothetical protein